MQYSLDYLANVSYYSKYKYSKTMRVKHLCLFFFFNDTATTEIYTLSLHDALPISPPARAPRHPFPCRAAAIPRCPPLSLRPTTCGTSPRPSPPSSASRETPQSPLPPPPSPCRAPPARSPPCPARDRKSIRLNSSHG